MTTYETFKDWCKQTNRSGGVLVGSSIKEFCDFLDSKQPSSHHAQLLEYQKLKEKFENNQIPY